MTSKTVTAGCAALLMAAALMSAAGPALAAASEEARQACERKAVLVRPILRAPEREAFIANCLADSTWKPSQENKKSGSNY